ncbi:hypothetical protein PILCRDRAFT_816911 [Piloderma croceum F 1598]|uniref:Phosphoglycerate mutase-like protein n=1 Tax=Piloderma croceum (strain F 1598) TaxID=765440 RepID=A0A0C3BHC7_PILCF|nr:hypothetical protein PILCRDRAFT_816911 [Piloderma croceum F 1598]
MTVTIGGLGVTASAAANGQTTTSNAQRLPQIPLDVEQYPVAPCGLELKQVHVFVRHGERTPVGVRMRDPPASIPEHWMMCKAARNFRAAVAGLTGLSEEGANGSLDGSMPFTKRVERMDGTSIEGECLLGELTDVGRKSTYNYGQALRRIYIEKLGFLPDTLRNGNEVYLRSTNMPRTIESLQQIIHGFYPTSKCDVNVTPTLFVRNGKDENLIGNAYGCKRLEVLLAGFAQAAAGAYNKTLEPLDKIISKYIGGNPIRVDGKPRASGVMDTIRAAIAHGIKVPPEFRDKSVVDVIEQAVVAEWFSDKTEEVRRLGVGRLLVDVSQKMQAKIDRDVDDPLKILVHSTHDTSLAAICATLDVFDDNWPAFTASITFELFTKREEQNQGSYLQTVLQSLTSYPRPRLHYVRMRYQNKDMVLPLCAAEGDHLPGSPEFCTLKVFQDRVKALTPEDWDLECSPSGR